jgi:formylglycine-generating enzyme required for sulfatase activity
LIVVAAGTFTMGDGVEACNLEHEVTLTRDFYLGQHEVTNQEYLEALQWALDGGLVVATTSEVTDNLDGSTMVLLDLASDYCEIQFDGAGTFYLRESPSAYAQAAYPEGYDPAVHPVKEVSWYGAARYCDWMSWQAGLDRAYDHDGDWACNNWDVYGAEGYRLPTDAEREYAAQYDDERVFPWGNDPPACGLANHYDADASEFCVGWTTPVGSYPDAPGALGLSDMAGNLWEWCNDWWVCDLGTDPQVDPVGPDNNVWGRIPRGGSWYTNEGALPCAGRDYYDPGFTTRQHGFRVARTVPSTSIENRSGRSDLHLEINRPNPFTSVTGIACSIPRSSAASLQVHDVSGRLVRSLLVGGPAGRRVVSWNGTNETGGPVPAGIYFYRLADGEKSVTRRMLLVR